MRRDEEGGEKETRGRGVKRRGFLAGERERASYSYCTSGLRKWPAEQSGRYLSF